MKIAPEILDILANGTIENNTYFLPQGQLARKTYEAANKCLVNIGGKWNKKAKGHVFDYDPTEEFENLILTGETNDMKKEFQFFPTPELIAEQMCEMAELDKSHEVLEPSCGKGDLADVIYKHTENVFCIEINSAMGKYLKDKPYPCAMCDFLDVKSGEVVEFDRIVMNPPFSRQQDIDHVYHAYDLLKSSGVLVSVMSPSPFFRSNKKSVDFVAWLNELDAEIVDVPEGTFKVSGTMIKTKIIKIRKP